MNKKLFTKFINNSCTEEERESVYAWISDPRNKDEVSAMMKISWDKMDGQLPEDVERKRFNIENVLQKNGDLMTPSEFSDRVEGGRFRSRHSYYKWKPLKIAATVILAVSLICLLYRQMNLQSEEVSEMVFMEKANPEGRKSTIILPDRSKVKLNSGSKLRYKKEFNDDTREVILEGEAFFEVEKDKSRPFIIKTGDITTTVLGTSFNINAYAKHHEIHVAVVSGQVEVKKSDYYDNEDSSATYLTPNRMAVYNREARELEITEFNMEEITGWKDGILIFKNADMSEIAMKLKRWYGLEVEINGSSEMLEKRYTGKFDNNSLEYVLKAISYTSEIGFEIKDNKKVILIQK